MHQAPVFAATIDALPLHGSLSDIARALRVLVSEVLIAKPPEEFLNLFLTRAFAEQAAPDLWHDLWSPAGLFRDVGFESLRQLERVRACGAERDGTSLIIVGGGQRSEISLCFHNGDHQLRRLREMCAETFRTMGHHHWVTATDVVILAEALNIGSIIMSDRP